MISRDNLTGIGFMVLAMASFAGADAAIKLLTESYSPGQVIFITSLLGLVAFGTICRFRRYALFTKAFFHPAVLIRNLCEVLGASSVVLALAFAPLSLATAIFQANPLLVTLGAAVILKEPVGIRRWSAVVIGLFGVLLVVQPWKANFELGAAMALFAAAGLAGRDLSTRSVPKSIPTEVIATYALAVLTPIGLVLMYLMPLGLPPRWPASGDIPLILIASLTIIIAYYAITAAMRAGEVSVVAPFRYSRIVFGLLLAVVVFGETLSPNMLIGAAIIVAAGLYTLSRETRR